MPKVARYAIENSEALRRKFRHRAGRALMILREYKGIRKGVGAADSFTDFIGCSQKNFRGFCNTKRSKKGSA